MADPQSSPDSQANDELARDLKERARDLGFQLSGITSAAAPETFPALKEWLDQGHAGEMGYLERRLPAYADPTRVMEGVRSVVMLGMSYHTEAPVTALPGQGRVARYAWGTADYHDLIRTRLQQLKKFLIQRRPGATVRGIVDTAPLLERDFARRSGLGWFGKNTLLLNRHQGSLFLLAALLTDLDLPRDAPHTASHCGTCTRCLDACPTDAFVAPYQLDARRCISYLTIELRGPIPLEFRGKFEDWAFGCDICQDVCPWNRKASRTHEPAFQPQSTLHPADLIAWLTLSPTEFDTQFAATPLERPGRSGLLRNAAVVLGSQRYLPAIPALSQVLHDEDPVIRGAAAWALGQMADPAAQDALTTRLVVETEPAVTAEIQQALTEPRGSPTG